MAFGWILKTSCKKHWPVFGMPPFLRLGHTQYPTRKANRSSDYRAPYICNSRVGSSVFILKLDGITICCVV